MGYPILEREDVEQLIPFIREGKEIVWMVDSIETWEWLQKIGEENDIILLICLDINVSTSFPFIYFGTKRSPLTEEKALKDLLGKRDQTQAYKGCRIDGV